MIEKEFVVTNPKGIHARPSGLIAQAAAARESSVVLIKDGRAVDAKVVLNILSLVAQFNDKIIVRIDGHDEQEALEAIADAFDVKYD